MFVNVHVYMYMYVCMCMYMSVSVFALRCAVLSGPDRERGPGGTPLAMLTWKPFNFFFQRGQRLTDPSCSLLPPEFPSG